MNQKIVFSHPHHGHCGYTCPTVGVSLNPSSPPPGKEMKLTNRVFHDAHCTGGKSKCAERPLFLLPKILDAVNIFPLFHKGYQSFSFSSDIVSNYY